MQRVVLVFAFCYAVSATTINFYNNVGSCTGATDDKKDDMPAVEQEEMCSASPKESAYTGWDFSSHGANWGSLTALYRRCTYSVSQSPIDIVQANAQAGGNIELNLEGIKAQKIRFFNNGHAIQADMGKSGMMLASPYWFGDCPNTVLQFHFHSESEHEFDGARKAAEMHIVTKGPSGIAVWGFMFELDTTSGATDDPFLADFASEFANLAKKGDEVEVMIDFNKLQPGSSVYSYQGSFTTPPCTDDVTWFVAKDTHKITQATLTALQAAMTHDGNQNYRAVQALNNRVVRELTRL